ncbi:hypothetical protein [Oceanobacillus jeddahense]|uniref:hypothetical protein n=1 Tax=Oceanobacillus jeddahense TaxID=1462527 RepID=UPI000595EE5F|nr:hypothetical protein [Oceanobacillus jeddahense]
MKQSIEALKSDMYSTLELKQGIIPQQDLRQEIAVYVDAINILELYMYRRKETHIKDVLD